MPKSTDNLGSRLTHIDSLRAVAVLLVIFHHYFQYALPSISNGYLAIIGNFFISFGASGVQIFFTLSGFILLNREKVKIVNESFFKFMLFRYSRLWPGIFILTLTTLPLIDFKLWVLSLFPSFTLIDPTFFNKFLPSKDFVWMSDVMWSLFSEIRFYLIFAIIFSLTQNKSLRSRALIVVSFLGLGKIVSLVLADAAIFRAVEFITLSRDSSYFALGILLSLCFDSSNSSPVDKIRSCIFPVFVALSFESCTKTPAVQEYFVLIPIIAILTLMSSSNPLSKLLANYFGRSSYLSYLLHMNIILLVFKFFGDQTLLSILIIIPIMTCVIAYGLERFFEQGAIRLLRRFLTR